MKLSEAFPSNFLKADDLAGAPVTVTIAAADIEEIGKEKEKKLVLSFKGTEKKMVCNKTNANVIEKFYGNDTDGWVGKPITLLVRDVDFQGETKPAIRVSSTKPAAAVSTKSVPLAEGDPEPVKEDDVPF